MSTEQTNGPILVVDDELSVRESLGRVLEREGFRTFLASNAEEAEKALANESDIAVVLTDFRMPEVNGIELLRRIKKGYPNIEVVLITGHGTVERAVEAMKEGAYDFITKPFKRLEILRVINKAIEKHNLSRENLLLKAQIADTRRSIPEFIGRNARIREIMGLLDRVAPLSSTVLVSGESGTGKEIIARMIHTKSPRADNRFVAINCGAIAENLIESELFGHIKGAFTGAIRDKEGLFKIASSGTLFLDEISTIPINLQVKLLRALEAHEIMPVGSAKTVKIDVRIISASNRDLLHEVEQGRFREDLYYRLNVVAINIPPLRERYDDIPRLVEHFIRKFNRELNKDIRGVSQDTLQVFLAYKWKGNVRELENAIERAMILCDGQALLPEHLPQSLAASALPPISKESLKEAVTEFERMQILKALELMKADKKSVAKMLGMSLSSLYRKMADLGLDPKDGPIIDSQE